MENFSLDPEFICNVLTAQSSGSLPEWVWLILACDSEWRCVGNLFYFIFLLENEVKVYQTMGIWELGQPNEEVKPSYKMSSAHCTYLLSADISLTFKYELVTSLWAWYCSESGFWLEHGGTTLLGHRRSSCQVRCRASGVACEHNSLGSLALLFLANGAVKVGKKKANLFLVIKKTNDWSCYKEFMCISNLWK